MANLDCAVNNLSVLPTTFNSSKGNSLCIRDVGIIGAVSVLVETNAKC